MNGIDVDDEPMAAISWAQDAAPEAAMMREWRRRYRSAEWAHLGSQPGGRARRLKRVVGRPIRAFAMAVGLVQNSFAHSLAAGPHRVSRPSQFVQLWWLRMWYGIEGRDYYRLGLYERGGWHRARNVVREREVGRFVRLLNSADPARGREMLADKERTAAWCVANQLPTVVSLVTVEAGRITQGAATAIPDTDLFSKPARSFGGSGVCRWVRVASNRWVASDDLTGTPVGRDGVLDALCAQSRQGAMPVLLQPALVNHSDVAGLTNGALATIRFVTLRARSGDVSPISATYRIPTGDAVIDAFSHGGMAAPVDLATGCLDAATTTAMASVGESTSLHPDTGAQIKGTSLPDWDATVALVLRAHRAIPGAVPLIGWDVALTNDGPVLIEGNVPPSVALMQVPSRTPLGETPIVACILDYLRAIDES